jgi:hypothetical protein
VLVLNGDELVLVLNGDKGGARMDILGRVGVLVGVGA